VRERRWRVRDRQAGEVSKHGWVVVLKKRIGFVAWVEAASRRFPGTTRLPSEPPRKSGNFAQRGSQPASAGLRSLQRSGMPRPGSPVAFSGTAISRTIWQR
jgi:hypothetical protein